MILSEIRLLAARPRAALLHLVAASVGRVVALQFDLAIVRPGLVGGFVWLGGARPSLVVVWSSRAGRLVIRNGAASGGVR